MLLHKQTSFATHVTWLAPVVACSSAESSSHLTASPTASTKKTVSVFFCAWELLRVLHASKLCLQPTSRGWRPSLQVSLRSQVSLDCTFPPLPPKRPLRSFFFAWELLRVLHASNVYKRMKKSSPIRVMVLEGFVAQKGFFQYYVLDKFFLRSFYDM